MNLTHGTYLAFLYGRCRCELCAIAWDVYAKGRLN